MGGLTRLVLLSQSFFIFVSLFECPNLSVKFRTHFVFYMALLSPYGMVSVTLRRSLVSSLPRYFVYLTPHSVTDLLICLHYSWIFSSSTESFRPYRALLLSWWDWQPWQYCQTFNIITFPISRDVAVTIHPLQWHMASTVSSCQHFCCTIFKFQAA